MGGYPIHRNTTHSHEHINFYKPLTTFNRKESDQANQAQTDEQHNKQEIKEHTEKMKTELPLNVHTNKSADAPANKFTKANRGTTNKTKTEIHLRLNRQKAETPQTLQTNR